MNESKNQNENELRILDVAISVLKQAMWVQTGQPSRTMHQFADWAQSYVVTRKAVVIEIFRESRFGLIESMQDIEGDFCDAIWARIQARKAIEGKQVF